MKIVSEKTNFNSNLPMTMALFELDNSEEKMEEKNTSFENHFSIFKKRNFSISEPLITEDKIVYCPESNYSNYEISKIFSSDFKKNNFVDFLQLLEIKIREWAKVYNAIKPDDLEWLVKYTLSEIESIMSSYTEYYIFDLPAKEENEKRHPHFSLYEFFVSFIFCGHKHNKYIMGYGLLAYA